MSTYVIVHGAWHDGTLMAQVAAPIRAACHEVHAPTIAGNGKDANKDVGLEEAIASIADYITQHDLRDIVLAGHSYGGFIITGIADRMLERIRRLVYWNAFVPYDGESLLSIAPAPMGGLFKSLADASDDNSVALPYPVWRDVFFNDGDEAGAKAAYAELSTQPYRTFADKISLKGNPAAWEVGKSYINGLHDVAMPGSNSWHPGQSEKLGLFRLVQMWGGHETCFIDPQATAEALMQAGSD